jgi:MFS family permease
LIFWRFVSGLGIGLEMATIGTYISELVPKQIRGRAFACEQAVGFMAVPIVAFLSYLLLPGKPLEFVGRRWVVMIAAHGVIFVWFIRRALPESPRWLAQNGRLAKADAASPLHGEVCSDEARLAWSYAPTVSETHSSMSLSSSTSTSWLANSSESCWTRSR